MYREYTDSDINNIVKDYFNGEVEFYSRYTNINGFKFYLLRDKFVRINYSGHKPEWYVNFFGFYKSNVEFDLKIINYTFGVRNVFKETYRLNKDDLLKDYLYGEGEYQFRSFLNSVNEICSKNDTLIATNGGKFQPLKRNGIIIPNRDRGDEQRLVRIAEKEFVKTIIDNNGLQPLSKFNFEEICFVPSDYIRIVKTKLVHPEYMDTEYGVLTEKGREVINSILRDETVAIDTEQDILRIINKGESANTEFKSTLRWNIKDGQIDKEIEFAVIKTVTGFLNANGGILIIGVDDNGEILGLEYDYNSLKDNSWDKFQLCLTEILWKAIPKSLCQSKTSVYRFIINGKDICVIIVKPSTTPVFLNHKNQKKFYVRTNNSTREMEDVEEIVRYCIEMFGRNTTYE